MPRSSSQLTKTEKEILDFLWDHGSPLTASEIVELYPDRKWKASYIHLLVQSMLKKKVIRIDGFKPTCKNYARAFAPAISKEAYMVHEMVKDLHLDRENIHNLMVYLINSASDLETVTSMLELCEKKRQHLI